ncbi:MAG: DUF6129 family protein [Pseudomonadota bacterium]
MSAARGLEPAMLDEVRRVLVSSLDMTGAASSLRGLYPGVHFTVCSENDMPARQPPFMSCEGFDLYLADAGQHCIQLTGSLENASGVVIALHDEDDDA